jgi:Tol biopolymer transport system component
MRVALALTLVLVCGATISGAAASAGVHRNGVIAFVTEQQLAPAGLVAVSPDGGKARTLDAAQLDAPPVPSPDGTRLALIAGDIVDVVRTNGSDMVSIGEGRSPTWSPDGGRLVFVSEPASEIETASAAGGQLRDLGVTGSEPVWSPSGEWIAFFSDYSTLELIHPDGTGRTVLATNADSLPDEIPLAWSPDGTWLSFGAVPADTHVLELNVIRSDGSGRRSFGNSTPPTWSPHADVFAFTSTDDGFEIAAADGSVRFSSKDLGGTAAWSPSGDAVALGTYDLPGISIVDAHTGATRHLSLGGVPTWSPNGRQIAAIRGSALRVVAATGGRPRVIARGAGGNPLWLQNGLIAYDTAARMRSVIETDSGRVLLRGPAHQDGARVDFAALTWSPDGRALATEYGGELWTAAADGSRAHVLARGVTDTPSWSPDGRRLALFAGDALRVVGVDGGPSRLLTRVADVAPAWSPDGRHIAVENGNGDLYVIRPDGRGLRRLAANVSSAPSWSPDGKRIAFSTGEPYTPTAIETIRVDGGGLRTVASAPAAGDEGDVLFGPLWSPDGRAILYGDDEYFCGSKCDDLHLVLIRPDGTDLHRLRNSIDSASWSPNGKKLIGVVGDNSLVVVDVRTGNRRLVAAATEAWSWQPLAP